MNKSIINTILFLVIFFTIYYDKCNAQWLPDVRLTNNGYESLLSSKNVASSGNYVHVVWQDNRDLNNEIYYKRSTNSGNNWSSDTRLTNTSSASYYPSVAVSGSIVHVIWNEDDFEIYYKRSTDWGNSWGSNKRLTNSSGRSDLACLAASGSLVHVAWRDDRDGNYEIYYKRSTNGGSNWSAETRLTNYSGYSTFPSIAASGSAVYLVWCDNRFSNYDIFYKFSSSSGSGWGPDTRLTNHSSESSFPSIAFSDSLVHVVWQDDRDGNPEIYYKRSSDWGVSWGPDTRGTFNASNSRKPVIYVSGLAVHVVWYDDRDGNNEVYYIRSTNTGLLWGTPLRLTINPSESSKPSITVLGPDVHVIWNDLRDGNWEIYYKTNPTGNPFGIKKLGEFIPEKFCLFQNYPNPFNPSTKIRFALPCISFVKLVIYDLLGREIKELINEQLSAGNYEAEWNSANLASGEYFYKMTAGDFTGVKKMILTK